MMNWIEFFAMGGYAWYVWPSWILAVFVLVWNYWIAKRGHARLLEQLELRLRREQLERQDTEQ